MAPVQKAATVTIVTVQTPRIEYGLAGGERSQNDLHGRVAAGEERGRRHHRGDALEVAGADVTGLARRERAVVSLPP